MLGLLGILTIGTPFYFVADAYYAAGKVVKGLLEQGHHLISRVKSDAVAYALAEQRKGKRKRGAPKRYGKKIKLKSLLSDTGSMQEVASPVYGERNVILRPSSHIAKRNIRILRVSCRSAMNSAREPFFEEPRRKSGSA
jgi:hypothetical protein